MSLVEESLCDDVYYETQSLSPTLAAKSRNGVMAMRLLCYASSRSQTRW